MSARRCGIVGEPWETNAPYPDGVESATMTALAPRRAVQSTHVFVLSSLPLSSYCLDLAPAPHLEGQGPAARSTASIIGCRTPLLPLITTT